MNNGGYYDNPWEIISRNGLGRYEHNLVSIIFSLLIIMSIVSLPLVWTIFLLFQLNKFIRTFPSIKDARNYYKDLKKVKIAKVKADFKIKMAKVEEEKKKYL